MLSKRRIRQYNSYSLLYSSGQKEGELEDRTEVVQQLISVIREKNYSPRTLEAYIKWTRQFLTYYEGSFADIDDSGVRKFLNYLSHRFWSISSLTVSIGQNVSDGRKMPYWKSGSSFENTCSEAEYATK